MISDHVKSFSFILTAALLLIATSGCGNRPNKAITGIITKNNDATFTADYKDGKYHVAAYSGKKTGYSAESKLFEIDDKGASQEITDKAQVQSSIAQMARMVQKEKPDAVGQ